MFLFEGSVTFIRMFLGSVAHQISRNTELDQTHQALKHRITLSTPTLARALKLSMCRLLMARRCLRMRVILTCMIHEMAITPAAHLKQHEGAVISGVKLYALVKKSQENGLQ